MKWTMVQLLDIPEDNKENQRPLVKDTSRFDSLYRERHHHYQNLQEMYMMKESEVSNKINDNVNSITSSQIGV